tara:strand:+ start:1322 stop:1510 length:189 start_codon:yes stop_codon:yes gene_type:complete
MAEFIITVMLMMLFCSVFILFTRVFCNEKNSDRRNNDNRDPEEKRIAGEDTSEIALNYLKKL